MMIANDDLVFKSGNWTSRMTKMLKKTDNIGIVSFKDLWQEGPNFFVVHSSTHLTLLDGHACPIPYSGAHCDLIIYEAYAENGFAWIDPLSIVQNRVGIKDGKARYDYGSSEGYQRIIHKIAKDIRECFPT